MGPKPSHGFAVVGAGMLGLSLALLLRKAGHNVTVIEASDRIGGQTSTWQLGPLVWDRHYHVISQDDHHLIRLLEELGIAHKLHWNPTQTGFYASGRLHSLSNIAQFLKFPVITLPDKFRLGLTLLRASSLRNLKPYEQETSIRWLTRWSGINVTEKLWSPLLQSKFGGQFSELSAAFIISNIQRMFGARKGKNKQEVFGYVEGGYETILTALKAKLEDMGVQILLSSPVQSLMHEDGKTVIRLAGGETLSFNRAVLTAAPPVVARLCPGLTDAEKERFAHVDYLGIACASLLLQKPVSPYYITNILDRWIPFTGVIEMSALTGTQEFGGLSLLYLPRYLPSDSPELAAQEGDESRTLAVLEKMYPHFRREDVKAFRMSRVQYILPVPTAQLQQTPLPVATSLPGVYMLGTGHITDGVLTVNKVMALAEYSLAQCLAPG